MGALPLFDLSGRTALVTGSSGGLGFAMVGGLAEAGARLVLNGRDGTRLEAAAHDLARAGHLVSTMPFDVADETAIQAAFDRLDRDGIAVDILVNNAGIHFRKPMIELAGTDWRRVVDTNLIAAFLIGREAAPHDPAGRRHDHQHRLRDVGGRPRNHRALHGRKGRHQDAHALNGSRMGGPQYPGQRDRAGIYRNGNESG